MFGEVVFHDFVTVVVSVPVLPHLVPIEVRGQFQESVPEIQFKAEGLCGKQFYPLSHLVSPVHFICVVLEADGSSHFA